MPNTRLHCRERDWDRSENAPEPSPSPEPQVSPPADIAGLVDRLSRFQHRDSEDAQDMPLPDGGGPRDGTQHSPAAAGSVKPDHVNMDPALSTDESQSPSSDDDTLEGDRFDRGKSEMIDRIMRSFCASLDSKIAVAKGTEAPRMVKKEEETEPRTPILAATKITTEAVCSKSARKQSVRKKARRGSRIQPLAGPSAATSPGAGASPPSTISALAPVLAAAPAPAAPAPLEPPPPRDRPIPQAPCPPPPPLPVAQTRFRDRLFSRQSAVPPPPPTPSLGRRGREFASQPPLTAALSGNVVHLSQNEEVSGAGTRRSSAGNSNILRSASREQESIILGSHLTPAQFFPGSLAERAEQRVARTPPAANLDLHIRRPRPVVPASELRTRRVGRFNRPSASASNAEPTTSGSEVPQEGQTDEVHGRLSFGALQEGQPDLLALGGRAEVPDVGDDEDGFAPADSDALDFSAVESSINFTSTDSDPFLQPDSISHAFNQTPSTASGSWAYALGTTNLYGGAPVPTAQTHVPAVESQSEEVTEGLQAPQRMKRAAVPEESQLDPVQQVRQDADGDGRRKKSRQASLGSAITGEKGTGKFACPYFKRNPNKYRKWTSCPGPGWDEVHRVKTHLYRRHPLPIQCPRCWEAFKADGQLQTHLQQDPPCSVQRNRTLQEGFTKDQEKKLRSRRKTHADMTDEDKWREIYMVLFPDDDQGAIPSPYYSGSEDGKSHNPNCSGELEDYATFIRREMPTLVRRELETLFQQEFQDVEERMRPRIADIVLNLQPRLLSLYKQSQMPLSEYGPQQHEDTTSSSEPTLTPLLSQGTDSATGTGPDSTPDTVFGTDNVFRGTDAQLGFYDSGLDQHWDAVNPENQVQTQEPGPDTGLGLNWDFEFDKLLNPALFMPLPGEMQTGYASQA